MPAWSPGAEAGGAVGRAGGTPPDGIAAGAAGREPEGVVGAVAVEVAGPRHVGAVDRPAHLAVAERTCGVEPGGVSGRARRVEEDVVRAVPVEVAGEGRVRAAGARRDGAVGASLAGGVPD